MISQADMEELREDCLHAQHEEEQKECLMSSDLDYFLAKSNYENALDSLMILKSEADTYNYCIHELVDRMKEEI